MSSPKLDDHERMTLTFGQFIETRREYPFVQIGADWCGLDKCNYEAFASKWFGATSSSDWIEITAGK
jgi:hypothetical protein